MLKTFGAWDSSSPERSRDNTWASADTCLAKTAKTRRRLNNKQSSPRANPCVQEAHVSPHSRRHVASQKQDRRSVTGRSVSMWRQWPEGSQLVSSKCVFRCRSKHAPSRATALCIHIYIYIKMTLSRIPFRCTLKKVFQICNKVSQICNKTIVFLGLPCFKTACAT